jgi:hypothetical protein
MKKYGVPRTTLQYWLHSSTWITKNGHFKRVFTPDKESQLREHVVTLQKIFYGTTDMDMGKFAFDFAEVNLLQHTFSQKKKMADPDWLVGIFHEVQQLVTSDPGSHEHNRVAGFTRPKLMGFFGYTKASGVDIKLQKHV